MTKQYTIKSKFLNSLNEALEKMALKDDIKVIKSPILEADGNFTSIISSSSDNFDPSKINSNILVDKKEQDEDIVEKKNALTAKALDKIKQTLDVSDELQSILGEINKLNKDTDYNTWKVNSNHNTANLRSKNAYIFLQNDNICLSHDNQVEIFKSVNELHEWLKKHNYPLPKNIKLHESVLNEDHYMDSYKINYELQQLDKEIKELSDEYHIKDRNLFDDIEYAKKEFPNKLKEIKEKIAEFNKQYPNEKNRSTEQKIEKAQLDNEAEKYTRVLKKIKNTNPEELQKQLKQIDDLNNKKADVNQRKDTLDKEYAAGIATLNNKSKDPTTMYSPNDILNNSNNINSNFTDEYAEECANKILEKGKPNKNQPSTYNSDINIGAELMKSLEKNLTPEELKGIRLYETLDDSAASYYKISIIKKDLDPKEIIKKLPEQIEINNTLFDFDNKNYAYKEHEEEDSTGSRIILSRDQYLNRLKKYMGKWYDLFDMDEKFTTEQVDPEEIRKQKIAGNTKWNAYHPMSWEDTKLANSMIDNSKPKKKKKNESLEEDSFDTNNLWYLIYQNPSRDETFYLNDNWKEGNLLSNNLQQASAFLNREEAIDTLKELYSYKQTSFPFKPIQEKFLGECGVTCASLGPAIQYTADKKDLQEDDLQEMANLSNDNKRYGYGNVRTGNLTNTLYDLQRNSSNINNKDDLDNAKRTLDDIDRKRSKEIFSKNLSHKEYKPDFHNTYPDLFLNSLAKKAKDMRILNKDQFIAQVQKIMEELPENMRFDPNDLIISDENGNPLYNWGLTGLDKDIKKKRDAFSNHIFDKYWKPFYKRQKGDVYNTQQWFNSENPEKKAEYAKYIQDYRQNKDILNRNIDFNTNKPGRRINFNTVITNTILKPYFDKFVELTNSKEKDSDDYDYYLTMWLMKNIELNNKLKPEEKSKLIYGILESLTKFKENDIESGDIYEPDPNKFIEYNIIKSFILRNKIKPGNIVDYLDDKEFVDKIFNESISPFKQQFMKYLNNNLQDITLKEDDSPEDFATNIQNDLNNVASNSSQSSLDDQGSSDLNLDDTSSLGDENSDSGVNFGDINIQGGAGDYGPEEDEENQMMPMEPVEEYKIVDVLVNDDNPEDIRVKVQNLTTGEIETKELSEIDI